jgi:hypothetical protein
LLALESDLTSKQFSAAHAETMVTADFFSVDTIFFKRLYAPCISAATYAHQPFAAIRSLRLVVSSTDTLAFEGYPTHSTLLPDVMFEPHTRLGAGAIGVDLMCSSQRRRPRHAHDVERVDPLRQAVEAQVADILGNDRVMHRQVCGLVD